MPLIPNPNPGPLPMMERVRVMTEPWPHFTDYQSHLEVKYRLLGPTPNVSDSAGLSGSGV